MDFLPGNDALLTFDNLVTPSKKVDYVASLDDRRGLEQLGLDHVELQQLCAVIVHVAEHADAFLVEDWDLQKGLSDLMMDGLRYKGMTDKTVIMIFESPSSFLSVDASFHNTSNYKFCDWPPPKTALTKTVLGPCRYASMNGTSLPVYLKDGKPPAGLEEHWARAIPGHQAPSFVSKIGEDDVAYAYLPMEQVKQHLNDPEIHYRLAGKDAIPMLTDLTTRVLPDTSTVRPCVVKTTHSMGSKGIFVIRNDDDEAECRQFLHESGHPSFIISEFVDIARNVACHFFIHPNGSVTWIGSNENYRLPCGNFSSDSYLMMDQQEILKQMQLPFVKAVVEYCRGLGFWGFCGIDVLFDSNGKGYLVDINPRITGSCPAIMTLKLLEAHYGFKVGIFRRGGNRFYYGPPEELFQEVSVYNEENHGKSRIVIQSLYELDGEKDITVVNIGVYGDSLEDCERVLNSFARPKPSD